MAADLIVPGHLLLLLALLVLEGKQYSLTGIKLRRIYMALCFVDIFMYTTFITYYYISYIHQVYVFFKPRTL